MIARHGLVWALVAGAWVTAAGCSDGGDVPAGTGGAGGHGGATGGGPGGAPDGGPGGGAGQSGGAAGGGDVAGRGGAGGVGGRGGGTPPTGLGGAGGGVRVINPGLVQPGTAGIGGGPSGGSGGVGTGGAGGAATPVAGTLALVAGRLGGPGNLDGVGPYARLDTAWYKAFDQSDRLLINDDGRLRAVDVGTHRVTTLGALPLSFPEDIFFQRGALYLVDLNDWQLIQVSPVDGHGLATISLHPSRPEALLSEVTSWPDGQGMFWVTADGELLQVDTTSGAITSPAITGYPPSAYPGATVMTGPSTMLVFVNGIDPPVNQILSIDVATAAATVVAAVPADRVVMAIDPGGEFAALDGGMAMPIGAGVAPAFTVDGPMTLGPQGSLLIPQGDSIASWDRHSSAPAPWVGLDRPAGPENLGPGESTIFAHGPRSLAARGTKAYLPGALTDGLAVVDLTTNVVSSLTEPSAINAAAVMPAPDGTLYLSDLSDCSLRQLSPVSGAVVLLPSPPSGPCLNYPGGMPTNPANHNWVRAGMALLDGSLFVASEGVFALQQLDLATGEARLHDFYGQVQGTNLSYYYGMAGLAVGSDGLLYGVDGRNLYRFDPTRQTATIIGPGSFTVAADQQGHVYTTDTDTVLRYDLATGQVRTVVGVPGSQGVSLGALPGSLSGPHGLAVTDGGDLLIGNTGEYVLLRAHFE